MSSHSDIERANQQIVVIHGLAANSGMTWLLQKRLRGLGYEASLFGYRSIMPRIEQHAQRLRRHLERVEKIDPARPLHLVVHSMGGIISRVMLEHYRPENLGRVVMLGTPNQGSHAARRLAPRLGWLCPALSQLSDAGSSWIHGVHRPKNIEIGVIAGAHDRVVSVEATRLPGAADHQVLPSGHGELLFRRDVLHSIDRFLCHGKFELAESLSATLATPWAKSA